MLNYIWLSLILLGIGVALYTDLHDISSNRYHNGEQIPCILQFPEEMKEPLPPNRAYPCIVLFTPPSLSSALSVQDTIPQKGELLSSGALHLFVDARTPALLRDIFK